MSEKMMIWGRELEVEVVYDLYKGEDILTSQIEAYEAFLNRAEELLPKAKEQVELYCLKNNSDELGESIDNIFKYVKPKTIYVKRTQDGEHKVALLCAYRFNPDDGLAVVFSNEEFLTVGTENIIL